FARIARRVAIAAPRAAPVLSPQCLPEHRTGGTHETLAAVSGIGRRARRRGRHGARWNRLGARYARVCGAVPMNREHEIALGVECAWTPLPEPRRSDRKSTRLNSSHLGISYAVFCLKKKKQNKKTKTNKKKRIDNKKQ